jgi:hypothetical protein
MIEEIQALSKNRARNNKLRDAQHAQTVVYGLKATVAGEAAGGLAAILLI